MPPSPDRKRRIITAFQVKVVNPPVRALAARGLVPTVALLETIGRKSGQPRANGIFYIVDDQDLVVVASNAGFTSDPAWAMNLRAQPAADVEIAAERRPVRGREASGDEVARLWPRLVAVNPDYDTYRASAGRPIPVFILEPR